MKLLPSVAFNDFSGSAGSVTARKIGDKTYLSSRTKHSKKKTPCQAAMRCQFTDTVRGYAGITEEQRQGWITLANNLGNYTTSTGSTSITGHNLFVAINTYRKICGKPLAADAPSELRPSYYINVGEFWISPERIVFTGVYLNENSNDVMLVEMYVAQNPSETQCWDKTSIVTVVSTSDWGEVDITEAFLKKFGKPLVIGQNVFIKVCRIDSECGYLQWYSMIVFPASERSYLNNYVYKPRARIGMDQIVPITNDMECEYIDFEISNASRIASNNIKIRITKGVYAGCEIPHKGLTDDFNFDRSFQYSRGTEEHNYVIQLMLVQVFNNETKAIRINYLAGVFVKHFEIFGTYYLTN